MDVVYIRCTLPATLCRAAAIVLGFFVILPEVGATGLLRTVALSGGSVPGTDAIFFGGLSPFEDLVLNDSGEVAFRGQLTNSPPFPSIFNADSGIWSEGRGDGLRLVARER